MVILNCAPSIKSHQAFLLPWQAGQGDSPALGDPFLSISLPEPHVPLEPARVQPCVPFLGSNRHRWWAVFLTLLGLRNQVAQEVAQSGDLHLQNL